MHKEPLTIKSFILSHEPLDRVPEGYYNLAGHIHPGAHLRGKGRQVIKLPCFYFGADQALMPAFGEFTGLAKIKPRKGDQVFVVVEDKVLEF